MEDEFKDLLKTMLETDRAELTITASEGIIYFRMKVTREGLGGDVVYGKQSALARHHLDTDFALSTVLKSLNVMIKDIPGDLT